MFQRTLAACFLVALCVTLAGSASQPPQQPSFKVEVNYVEVTARVTDAGGAFVADLEQDDFELLEEGRPQKVSDFRLVDLTTAPTETAPPAWRDADPDVQTNSVPFDGRVYVLVLDSLHVRPEQTREVRRIARQFLEKYFADGDMAAVVNTTGAADPAQEFTTSRAKLLSAVDKFGVYVMRPEGLGDIVPGGLTTLADDVLSSLGSVSELLGSVRGRRKAIVFFSEGPGFCEGGGPVGVRDDPSTQRPSEKPERTEGIGGTSSKVGPANSDVGWARAALSDGMRRLVTAANRGNVAVYGVDPRRLVEGSPKGSGGCDDLAMSVQSLRDISDQTGGFVTANTNDLEGGFDRIRQENSRYYVLGYYPAERAPEGSYRRIVVRTKRPGLQVQARQGYRVPPRTASSRTEVKEGEASPALREAMDSVLPVSGLRVSASAVPFRGDKAGADVLVSLIVDGRDITFKSSGGSGTGGLELAMGTMNSRGERGAGQYELVQLPLEEKSRASVTAFGIRIVRNLEVAPGRHQLRVGVVDRPTGRAGVVHLDLIVPDYRKTAFDMSGILLSSSQAGRVPTARGGPIEQLQRRLPGPPALTREFLVGEDLALYAELYGAVPGASVTATVVTEAGREVRIPEPSSPAAEQADPGAATGDRREIRRMIPLRALAPGRYLLRVDARSASDKPQTARRDVPFTIVP